MIRFIIIEAAAESSGPWQTSNPVSVPAELSFGKVGCSFWPALYIRLEKTQPA